MLNINPSIAYSKDVFGYLHHFFLLAYVVFESLGPRADPEKSFSGGQSCEWGTLLANSNNFRAFTINTYEDYTATVSRFWLLRPRVWLRRNVS